MYAGCRTTLLCSLLILSWKPGPALCQTSASEDTTALAQEAIIKASNPDRGDLFGNSVAISGDTMVIGALHEASNARGVNGNPKDNSLKSAGAAYVLVRSGDTWVQEAYLKASDPEQGRLFGWRVAIQGDTIAIGAKYKSNHQKLCTGYVYVFERKDHAWAQTACLQTDTCVERTDGIFTTAPTLDGDRMVTGWYVFERRNGAWTPQGEVAEPMPVPGAQMDRRVTSHAGGVRALSGDTLVMTALQWPVNQTMGVGNPVEAVYLFSYKDGTWAQTARLDGVGGGSSFGQSISLQGDTLVISAPMEDKDAPYPGAVYIYAREGDGWKQKSRLKAPDVIPPNTKPGTYSGFGRGVTLDHDLMVIGGNRPGRSMKYLYRLRNGAWTYEGEIHASKRDALSSQVTSVAVSSSSGTIVVGDGADSSDAEGINGKPKPPEQRSMFAPKAAPGRKSGIIPDNGAPYSGAAYVFRLKAS